MFALELQHQGVLHLDVQAKLFCPDGGIGRRARLKL